MTPAQRLDLACDAYQSALDMVRVFVRPSARQSTTTNRDCSALDLHVGGHSLFSPFAVVHLPPEPEPVKEGGRAQTGLALERLGEAARVREEGGPRWGWGWSGWRRRRKFACARLRRRSCRSLLAWKGSQRYPIPSALSAAAIGSE